MNAVFPIVADDIAAKKILVTMFNLSGPARTAGDLLKAHDEGAAYRIMAGHLRRRIEGNRIVNDIWTGTMTNMFGALLQGADPQSANVIKVNERLSHRDGMMAGEELYAAEIDAACRALGIELTA